MHTPELTGGRTSGLGNTFLNFHSIRGARLEGARLKKWHEENKRRHMRKDSMDAHPEQDH